MQYLIEKQRHLTHRRRILLDQLSECGNMIKGSINSVCSACNRSKCICINKTNHQAYRLTFKDKHQKTKIVYIPKNRLHEIKTMIKKYAKAWKIIERLIKINIQLFKQRLRT